MSISSSLYLFFLGQSLEVVQVLLPMLKQPSVSEESPSKKPLSLVFLWERILCVNNLFSALITRSTYLRTMRTTSLFPE
jgi:hypothetical protein